jgi:amino acid permease
MRFPYGLMNFIGYGMGVSLTLYGLYTIAVDIEHQQSFSLLTFVTVTALCLCTAYLVLMYLGMIKQVINGKYDWC